VSRPTSTCDRGLEHLVKRVDSPLDLFGEPLSERLLREYWDLVSAGERPKHGGPESDSARPDDRDRGVFDLAKSVSIGRNHWYSCHEGLNHGL
jgi:hypothetical protein